jgi:hypothetical protein
VEGTGSKIVELRGLGAVLVAAILGSEAASGRRGARIGRRQQRALASACGGRRLEYDNTRVDEADTRGRLPGSGTTARCDGLLVTQWRHKEQRQSWSEMATEELTMENRYFASPGSAGEGIRATG